MSSSPNSRSSSPAPSLVSFLSSSVIRTLQRLSSEVTGEDEFNSHRRDVQNSDKNHSYPRSNAPRAPPRQPSPYLPPALSSLILMSSSSNRSLLTEAIAEEIRLLIPARLQLHETWTLMYSLEEHGVSLSTLYQRLGKGAFVFVVKDTSDGIFGAFANESIQPSAGRYYGTGECFLWKASTLSSSSASSLSISNQFSSRTSDNIRFKAFPYSGVNDYMILCDRDFISFGGGNNYGKFTPN
ncbi:oxidation resistance protein 1, variant 2 [Orbilia oligospora]|uniref:Oxidation resistance protein 1 n=1 Tax=Orbilia oligospora TaxID=2813651 RepID=A0A7C8Q9Q1_ORBOL|nr:oxidation resistance protein 1, variant 2 [Orbilia oligospora]